MAVDV